VARQHLRQVGGARLLLALEEELQVHRARHAGRLQGVDGGQHRHDGGLVVAGGAPVEPPFRLRLSGGQSVQGHRAAALLQRRRPQHRRPGRARPPALVHRLAVVVGVDDDRAPRARSRQLAVDDGRAALALQQARADAPPLHERHDVLGVALYVGPVRGQVRDGHQPGQLAQHRDLVLRPPAGHRLPHVRRLASARADASRRRQEDG
jgi:hypothetical protein